MNTTTNREYKGFQIIAANGAFDIYRDGALVSACMDTIETLADAYGIIDEMTADCPAHG